MAETMVTRASIEARIAELRAKAERMPTHWTDRRAAIADEVDALVEDWLGRDA